MRPIEHQDGAVRLGVGDVLFDRDGVRDGILRVDDPLLRGAHLGPDRDLPPDSHFRHLSSAHQGARAPTQHLSVFKVGRSEGGARLKKKWVVAFGCILRAPEQHPRTRTR